MVTKLKNIIKLFFNINKILYILRYANQSFSLNFGFKYLLCHEVFNVAVKVMNKVSSMLELLMSRGTEKLLKYKTYIQGLSYCLSYILNTRTYYCFSLSLKKLGKNLMLTKTYITRVKSNLTTHAMDVGALTPFLWAFEEREKLTEIYKHIFVIPMYANCIQPGKISQDIPLGTLKSIYEFIKCTLYQYFFAAVVTVIRMMDVIFRGCYDRYLIRMAEMRNSLKIIQNCLKFIPTGEVKAPNSKLNPPKNIIGSSMESTSEHFKLISYFPRIIKRFLDHISKIEGLLTNNRIYSTTFITAFLERQENKLAAAWGDWTLNGPFDIDLWSYVVASDINYFITFMVVCTYLYFSLKKLCIFCIFVFYDYGFDEIEWWKWLDPIILLGLMLILHCIMPDDIKNGHLLLSLCFYIYMIKTFYVNIEQFIKAFKFQCAVEAHELSWIWRDYLRANYITVEALYLFSWASYWFFILLGYVEILNFLQIQLFGVELIAEKVITTEKWSKINQNNYKRNPFLAYPSLPEDYVYIVSKNNNPLVDKQQYHYTYNESSHPNYLKSKHKLGYLTFKTKYPVMKIDLKSSGLSDLTSKALINLDNYKKDPFFAYHKLSKSCIYTISESNNINNFRASPIACRDIIKHNNLPISNTAIADSKVITTFKTPTRLSLSSRNPYNVGFGPLTEAAYRQQVIPVLKSTQSLPVLIQAQQPAPVINIAHETASRIMHSRFLLPAPMQMRLLPYDENEYT